MDKGRGVGLHGPRHLSNRFALKVLVSVSETSTRDSLSSFVCLLSRLANRLAFERDQVRLVDYAIQQRHRHRWIAQVFRPVVEIDIRDDRGRASPITTIDHFVKQTQRIGHLFPLQLLEAEFVDDQQFVQAVLSYLGR